MADVGPAEGDQRLRPDAHHRRSLGSRREALPALAARVRAQTPLPALAAAIPPPASQGNREHLLFVADQAARFAATGTALASRHPDPEQLFERQNLMINLHRIVSELLTMALTVARSAGQSELQPLADAYCTAARHRVLRYWQRADDAQGPPGPDHEGISAAWLAGTGFGMLLDGVITQAPPA